MTTPIFTSALPVRIVKSSITGFASSLSAICAGLVEVGLAGELDLDALADADCRNAVDAEARQGVRHRLALRVEDLRLEHDVDDDASHGYSQPGYSSPPFLRATLSLPEQVDVPDGCPSPSVAPSHLPVRRPGRISAVIAVTTARTAQTAGGDVPDDRQPYLLEQHPAEQHSGAGHRGEPEPRAEEHARTDCGPARPGRRSAVATDRPTRRRTAPGSSPATRPATGARSTGGAASRRTSRRPAIAPGRPEQDRPRRPANRPRPTTTHDLVRQQSDQPPGRDRDQALHEERADHTDPDRPRPVPGGQHQRRDERLVRQLDRDDQDERGATAARRNPSRLGPGTPGDLLVRARRSEPGSPRRSRPATPGPATCLSQSDVGEPVAQRLLVEARLGAAGLPAVGRPEPRRVRREHLVGEDHLAVRRSRRTRPWCRRAGCRAARRSPGRGPSTSIGQLAQLGRAVGADLGDHLGVRHRLVVVGRTALGRGREDRLRQFASPRPARPAAATPQTDRYASVLLRAASRTGTPGRRTRPSPCRAGGPASTGRRDSGATGERRRVGIDVGGDHVIVDHDRRAGRTTTG